MRPLKVVLASAVTTLAIGSLAACGSSDDNGQDPMNGMMGDNSQTTSSTGTKTGFNDADVTFAQDMIPHHQQALEMVELTEGRALSPAAQAIVDGIQAAQAPEIETMSGWLKDWGKTIPGPSLPGHDMGDMGDMDDMGDDEMDGGSMGMMSSEQMMQLGNASDAAFEKMWLRMMVTHHEGAVEMAQTEVKDGEYADAVQLAQAIISGQTAEISKMNELLNR